MYENEEDAPRVRYKRVRYEDIDKMTPYQKWRVFLGFIQILATIAVPFIVIWLNEYLRNQP